MKKRFVAVLTAAVMGIGAMPAGVMAADSYSATEKAWLADALKEFGKAYGESTKAYKDKSSANVEFTLSLGEAGKALAGIYAPMDISWLENVTISDAVTVAGGSQVQNMDVLVNGTKVATVEFYMDVNTSDIYVRVPEISDAYLKVSQQEAVDAEIQAEGNDSITAFSDPAQIQEMMANLPEADVVTDILDRYLNIVLDHVADSEAAAETIEADGVTQEATMLEGTVSVAEARPMLEALIAEARDDESLKNIIETWTEGNEEFNYDVFQKSLTDLESDIKEEEGEDVSDMLASKIWLDENDQLIGRQFYVIGDESDSPEAWLTVWTPSEEGKKGLYVEAGSDGDVFSIEGSGTMDGDLLSGKYTFTAGGQSFYIDVKDFDTAAIEKGILKGTYVFPVSQLDESGMFEGVEVLAALDGDEKNSSMLLDLQSVGESLISLSITGTENDTAAEFPDVASFEKVYDATSNDEINEYTANINLDTVTANLQSAGMPDGFMEAVMGLLSGETPETVEENFDAAEAEDDAA